MSGIRTDVTALMTRLKSAEAKSQIAVKMFAQQGAKKFENYAKANRRWTDRTGRARHALKGWVEVLPSNVRVHIGQGVDYGLWLELCNERKYSILQPTVNAMSGEVIKAFETLTRYF